VSSVKLSYTLDDGATWRPIPGPITGSPADWTIPTVTKPKTRCKVKLALKCSSGKTIGSDTSDWNFTIEPAVADP